MSKHRWRKLTANVGMMAVGQLSSKLLGFLFIPLYTTVLSTTEYGVLDLLITTVALTTPVFTLIVHEAVLRFCLDKREDTSQIISIGLCVTLLGTLAVAAMYPLSLLVEGLNTYYVWFLAFFVTSNLHTLLSQFAKGIGKVKVYTIAGIISSVLLVGLNLLFLLVFKLGLVGYMLAYILSHLLPTFYFAVTCRVDKYIKWPFGKNRKTWSKLLRYSVPMIPNSICWWISNSSDKYMIALYLGTALTGVYSVSYRIPSLLAVASGVFMSAWQLSAVENFGSAESKKMFSNVYRLLVSVSVFGGAMLVAAAKPMAVALYQKDFFEAWKYCGILLAANVFQMLSAMLGSVYTSAKKTNMLMISTIVAAGANIALNFLLIPILGIYGAAIATLVSYILVWFIRFIDSRRLLAMQFTLRWDLLLFFLLFTEIALTIVDRPWSRIAAWVLCLAVAVIVWKPIRQTFKEVFLVGDDEEQLPRKRSEKAQAQAITPEFRYLLYCASVGAVGGEPKPPTEEIDWQLFFAYAKEQCVLTLVTGVLQNASYRHILPQPLLSEKIKYATKMAAQNYIKRYHAVQLMQELAQNGISSTLLKGDSVAVYYHLSDYRISSDTDILISCEDEEQTLAIMKRNGYTLTQPRPAISHHSVLHRTDAGTVEVHISLYGEMVENFWFSRIHVQELLAEHRRFIQTPEGSYRALGTTDTLIFVMLHAIKHFIAGGTCMRMLLDVGQCFIGVREQAGIARFWDTMEKIHCRRLSDTILSLLVYGGCYSEKQFPGLQLQSTEQVDSILHDMQVNGEWPLKELTVGKECWMLYNYYCTVDAKGKIKNKRAVRHWKNRQRLERFFPRAERLAKTYPSLQKHRLLYPFAWLHRLVFRGVRVLLKRRKSDGLLLKDENRLSPKAYERIMLFRKMQMIEQEHEGERYDISK